MHFLADQIPRIEVALTHAELAVVTFGRIVNRDHVRPTFLTRAMTGGFSQFGERSENP